MKRRTVLASVSSVLLAGCLTESSPRSSGTDSPKTSIPGTTMANQTRDTTTHGITESPSPNLRIPSKNDCLPFGESRVVCYQNAAPDTNLLMNP
ncbi:hypothetical protein [Haladaptatus sp. DFWS20]|uniref:hypothetical protein n=1 Tax=Haladaptatus sp. DFWS20 TaxID=3403467 RepID=UPI003EB8BE76